MIYFMRHGQTDFNKENKWMGLLDIPLNENGISQALSSINYIKSLNIDIIYCSELKRAIQTAASPFLEIADSIASWLWSESKTSAKCPLNINAMPKSCELAVYAYRLAADLAARYLRITLGRKSRQALPAAN